MKTESIASSLGSGKSFVPLKKAKERRQEDKDVYLGHEFAGTYRKLSPEQSDDSEKSDSDGIDDADNDTLSPQEELKSRLRNLDNRVRADPSDTTSWLSLVHIQKELIEMTVRQDKSKSNRREEYSVQRSIAEVQLSVHDRALLAHPSNATCIPLIMAKLDVAASSGAWDARRLEREWKQAIASCASDWETTATMWNSYLTWKISDSVTFTFRGILEVFADILDTFRGHMFRQEKGSEAREPMEITSLDMISRLVQIMIEADYVERAHGMLQALSELAFRRPSDLAIHTKQDFQISCNHLEDYWDLEEYQLGEAGSKGWSNFAETLLEDPGMYTKHPLKGKENTLSFGSLPKDLNDAHPITRWVALERARSRLRLFSAKETDEADWTTGEIEVDPFSFVIFSDISPFLIPIESAKGKEMLLNLFISILGAPQMTDRSSSRIYLDQFWPPHLGKPRTRTSWQVINGTAMQRERVSALIDPFKMPVKQWMTQLDNAFPRKQGEQNPWFSLWQYSNGQKEDLNRAKQVLLEQVSQTFSSTTIALTRLALSESVQSHKTTVKLAKQLLSQDRENSILWRAFARLERNNGNVRSARTVYKSLLNGQDTSPSINLASVWADWAELEWEAGEHTIALRILVMATSMSFSRLNQSMPESESSKQESISKLDLLRARRFFEQTSLTYNHGILFCAALFHYLSQEAVDSFDSAMQVFDKAMKVYQAGLNQEDIAMNQCKFIWRHIYGGIGTRRSRVFLPKDVTAVLTKFVLAFPHNTAFVALLAAFEMTSKVENVLRRVLEDKMQQGGHQINEQDWLVYLYCELHMNLDSVNESAVRKLFERALEAKR